MHASTRHRTNLADRERRPVSVILLLLALLSAFGCRQRVFVGHEPSLAPNSEQDAGPDARDADEPDDEMDSDDLDENDDAVEMEMLDGDE